MCEKKLGVAALAGSFELGFEGSKLSGVVFEGCEHMCQEKRDSRGVYRHTEE